MTKVSIIVLNWNGWRDTIECLESLYQIDYPDYTIILVDNGSDDESLFKIREYAQGTLKVKSPFFEYNPENKPIEIIEYPGENENKIPGRTLILIKNEINYGFTEGNNIGIRYALEHLHPDYIVLLNNDTVVDPHFLTELVKPSTSCEKIGIAGPRIYSYEEPEKTQYGGGKINWWIGKPIHCEREQGGEVEFVTGCCMLLNAKADPFFDPVYFAYFEDADLCMSMKRKGYTLVYTPSSKIYHKGSRSLQVGSESHVYHFARNRIIFMRKYAKFYHKIVFYPLQLGLKSIGSIFYFGIKGKPHLAIIFLEGTRDGLQHNLR